MLLHLVQDEKEESVSEGWGAAPLTNSTLFFAVNAMRTE